MTLLQVVRAGDLFDNLRREEEQEPQRQVEVKTNSILEWLINYNFLKEIIKRKMSNWDYYYVAKTFLASAPQKFTGLDVTQLSVCLPTLNERLGLSGLEQEYAAYALGSYLTACIALCTDKRVKLFTKNYQKLLGNIGVRNSKKEIVVIGDVGPGLAKEMRGGIVDVFGNCASPLDDFVGNKMRDGKVRIRGDVKTGVGKRMIEGIIEIDGRVDYYPIGEGMTGGKIFIEGDISTAGIPDTFVGGEIHLHTGEPKYSKYAKGSIYYKGRLIHDGGQTQ